MERLRAEILSNMFCLAHNPVLAPQLIEDSNSIITYQTLTTTTSRGRVLYTMEMFGSVIQYSDISVAYNLADSDNTAPAAPPPCCSVFGIPFRIKLITTMVLTSHV